MAEKVAEFIESLEGGFERRNLYGEEEETVTELEVYLIL